MRILLTGATGFIGRTLVSRLSKNHELSVVVRHPESRAPDGAQVVVMDLARSASTMSLPAAVDAIIHLAQANVRFPESADELLTVNTTATQRLLDYGRRAGARQFILASTGDVYGRRVGAAKETDAAHPSDYYAVTKYAAELLTSAYSSYMNPCILRLYQPYGPGQTGRLIPKLAERIAGRNPVRINKDDGPRLTPTYVDDVARAIERAIDSCCAGTLNIAGDREATMRELAEEIGRVIGSEPLFRQTGDQSGDIAGNNSLMKQALGEWEMTPLPDGLLRTFKDKEGSSWQARV